MATAAKPSFQSVAPVLFNAQWDEMGNDDVATGTSVETWISMRIM